MRIRTFHWVTLFALLFVGVLAAPKPASADDDDPPGRVARLSLAQGQVSFDPAGTDDWVSAVVNRPITTGDKLWTDQDGRAELHIGSAAIRLSAQTGFSFLNLNDNTMQIQLTEGTANIRVRRLAQDEIIEVDTPNLAFSILRPGRYRIKVNEEGDTTIVSVRHEGEGEVTGGGATFQVHPDEEGYFTGTDSLSANIQGAPEDDEFDQWSDQRDLREDHAVSRRYVSDDVIGYEDLDDNGGWRSVPEYGTVWFPHVSIVGWAPYRYGHWAYIAPWGWTWVDDAAWGFAPFHYGRWVVVGGAWGWVPCPPPVVAVAYVRPVYAPALVAWVGGPHFAVGVGVGGGFAAGVNVGWFPLGPREVFVPSYPVSRAYVTNVNVSNTTVNQTVVNNYYNTTIVNRNVTVNNNVRYVNQGVPGAVTATSGESFASARPVAKNLVAVNQREVATAPVGYAAPVGAPPKQAVLGAGAVAHARPPMAVQNRTVVAKRTPPPPPPPFARQQAAIQANQGRPISMAQVHQIQPEPARQSAAIKMAPPVTHTNPPPTITHTNAPPPVQPNRNVSPVPASPSSAPNNQPGKPANTHTFNDRPPVSRPQVITNDQIEQKHQNQNQQLQQKQDAEYQKLQQQHNAEQQKLAQQHADEVKQQQIKQQQQQQLQQLAEKQQQEQKSLHDKQQAEHKAPPPPPKPKGEEKDKPHR